MLRQVGQGRDPERESLTAATDVFTYRPGGEDRAIGDLWGAIDIVIVVDAGAEFPQARPGGATAVSGPDFNGDGGVGCDIYHRTRQAHIGGRSAVQNHLAAGNGGIALERAA